MSETVSEKRVPPGRPARSHSVIDSIKLSAFKGVTVPASYLKALPNYLQKNLRSKKYPNGQSVVLKHDENVLHIRRRGFENKLLLNFDGFDTITGLFDECVKKYTHKHYLGTRVVINKNETKSDDGKTVTKLTLGNYQWESYGEVWAKIQCYCAFLRHLEFDSTKKITLWADTSSEWLCMCLTLMYLKIPAVTVYSTLVDEAIIHALNLTETYGILVDAKSYQRLFKLLPQLPSIKRIFLTGSFAESDLEQFPDCVENPVIFDLKKKVRPAPKLPKNVSPTQKISKSLRNTPMFFSVDVETDEDNFLNSPQLKHEEENNDDSQLKHEKESDNRVEKHQQEDITLPADDSPNQKFDNNEAEVESNTPPTHNDETNNDDGNSLHNSNHSSHNDNLIAPPIGDDGNGTAAIKCFHLSQFIVYGRRFLKEKPLQFETVTKDDLALIMFTSGSSGIPKGVNIQHKSIVGTLSSASYDRSLWIDCIYPAYLPLAHIFEFIAEMSVSVNGGAIGFCTPLTLTDTSPMIEPGTKGDFSELRPTMGTFVPLLLERIKKNVLEKVNERGSFASSVLDYSVNHTKKMRRLSSCAPVVEKLAFSKIRSILGGNFRWAVCGGAPLSPLTHEFANIAFGFPIAQGYGLTETCASGTWGDYEDFSIDNAGPPIHCGEIKLIPWPEGGYYPNDLPNPRGEIVVGGVCVAMGYYNNEQATKESFYVDPETNQRWFKTSDIGEFLPNGTLKIIDRKKDIIKLKHGEYVSLVLVETIGSNSKYIELCCALPNNDHDFIVMLVMPNRAVVKSHLAELNSQLDPNSPITELLKDNALCEAIRLNILSQFSGSVHSKFEVPKKIFIVDDIWTPETGLLTPSMKIKRTEMKKFYFDILEI